jgi:hypothetical protein
MSARWTEEEYAAYLRRGEPARISEKAWQMAVTRLLKQHGYRLIYHTFDSRRSPSGFPDLVAACPASEERPQGRLIFAELKADDGIVRLEQQAWLDALAGCTGVVAEVWKPAMLSEIVRKLRGA